MHIIRRRQYCLHTGRQQGKQSFEASNYANLQNSFLKVGLRPVHGKFEIRDVGNLGAVVHEASRSACFLCHSFSVASHLCPRILHILFHLVQILGKTVRPDKGPDCKRTSVDRHNSHAGCPVLPLLPYDSPVRHSEVKPTNVLSLRSKSKVSENRRNLQQPREPKLGDGDEWPS